MWVLAQWVERPDGLPDLCMTLDGVRSYAGNPGSRIPMLSAAGEVAAPSGDPRRAMMLSCGKVFVGPCGIRRFDGLMKGITHDSDRL